MKLVEQHIVKKNKELNELTFQSKNLYNSCLYIIRQEYIKNNKYIGIKQLYYSIKKENIWESCCLPKKVTKQVVNQVDQNFKSYFAALKSYKKNPKKFLGRPKLPKYKSKNNGKNILIYDNQALSKKEFNKTGLIKLSKTDIKIKTKLKNFNDIKQVRIIPKNNKYVIEVVYNKEVKQPIINNNYASIDLGLNNLTTIGFNDFKDPFIIKGTPLKSINQFYNKKKAKIQSTLERRNKSKWSNMLNKLTNKRNNKIKDYLHKSSRYIVNQLVSKNISTLIIGKNNNWKQDINIGKKNNQNFIQIPFNIFIDMLTYKCNMEGIRVITQEESYSSKCSFLDNEDIKKHKTYKGKRIMRGLFKTNNNKIINADLNAAYNIMKKAILNNGLTPFDKIEDVAVHPKVITL